MLWQQPKSLYVLLTLAICVQAALVNNHCSASIITGPATPISSLIANNGTVTSGDKLFSDFTYLFSGDMPGAAGVNVVPITDDLGNYGIQFQGAFVDLPSSPGGSDAKITYKVTVTDPNFLISDAHMTGNPNLLGQFGSISVTETFLPLGANGEYTMEIYDDESLPTPKLTDVTFFNPKVKTLNVQKDILAIATQNSQTATLSWIDQSFSQMRNEIPEPTTIMMSLLGMVGLVGYLQRRERC
jgi:hypothetical protein